MRRQQIPVGVPSFVVVDLQDIGRAEQERPSRADGYYGQYQGGDGPDATVGRGGAPRHGRSRANIVEHCPPCDQKHVWRTFAPFPAGEQRRSDDGAAAWPVRAQYLAEPRPDCRRARR